MVQTQTAATGTPPPTLDSSSRTKHELAPARPWSADETIAFTPTGRATLERELRSLREERLPALAAQLAEAREDSAARQENGELVLIQLEQQRAERRATELAWLLSVAREITPPAGGVITLGSRVEVADDGAAEVYQVVDPREANAAEGRVSIASPVGQALFGRRVGDDVVVEAPAGPRPVRIVAVS